MAVKDDVIKAMKEAGKPMSAGEVEKATGIDRKEIDKAFKELKAEGAIVSPVRYLTSATSPSVSRGRRRRPSLWRTAPSGP